MRHSHSHSNRDGLKCYNTSARIKNAQTKPNETKRTQMLKSHPRPNQEQPGLFVELPCESARLQMPQRPHYNANAQMLKCSDAQMLKCTNAQMLKCTDAQMHKRSNAQMPKCTNAQMLKYSNAQTHRCSNANAQMHKCSNAQMHKRSDTQMLKCTNAQMHKC